LNWLDAIVKCGGVEGSEMWGKVVPLPMGVGCVDGLCHHHWCRL